MFACFLDVMLEWCPSQAVLVLPACLHCVLTRGWLLRTSPARCFLAAQPHFSSWDVVVVVTLVMQLVRRHTISVFNVCLFADAGVAISIWNLSLPEERSFLPLILIAFTGNYFEWPTKLKNKDVTTRFPCHTYLLWIENSSSDVLKCTKAKMLSKKEQHVTSFIYWGCSPIFANKAAILQKKKFSKLEASAPTVPKLMKRRKWTKRVWFSAHNLKSLKIEMKIIS